MSSFRARLQTIMILSVIVMCLGSPGLSLSHTCGQCVGDVVGPCFFTDGTCAPTLPDGSCPESSAICTCLRCSSQCVDNTGSCVEAGPSITSVAFGKRARAAKRCSSLIICLILLYSFLINVFTIRIHCDVVNDLCCHYPGTLFLMVWCLLLLCQIYIPHSPELIFFI